MNSEKALPAMRLRKPIPTWNDTSPTVEGESGRHVFDQNAAGHRYVACIGKLRISQSVVGHKSHLDDMSKPRV